MKALPWVGGLAVAAVLAYLVFGPERYGTPVEFPGGRVLYTGQATRADADRLGRFLARLGWFKPDAPKAVQLDLSNRRYVLRFPVRPGVENDPSVELPFRALGAAASKDVFGGAPVDVALCDPDFKRLRVLPFSPPRPPLPVQVTFRRSVGGTGLVGRFENTSARSLAVKARLANPTLGRAKDVVLELGPGRAVEYGWLEGWHFTSGETVTLEHADYEPLTVPVP